MKTLACRLGMTFVLSSMAVPASAAESGQAAPARAAAPPTAATNAPLSTVEHRGVIVGQSPQLIGVAADAQTEQGDGAENRLFFVTGDKAQEFAQRMKERLADPEQRAALRAEHRASMQQQYSEAGRVLGLDPAMEHKLIELLTDEQMSQLERMYSGARPHFDSYGQVDSYGQAQAITRQQDALRELLGEEGLDRFQDYKATLSDRRRVGHFSARLGAGNVLRPDQEERLIALLHEHTKRTIKAMRTQLWSPRWTLERFEGRAMLSPEEMQRESQLNTIATNEESWRSKQVANREIEKQAAAFLSPAQLAELVKVHAQEQEGLRRWIESARAKAGMDPKIPERAAAAAGESEQQRKPIDGDVQLELRLTVNREPTVVTKTVRNGESFTIEAADGLIAVATPTLYDDHWLSMEMSYYEQRAAGKRLLEDGFTFGVRTRMPDGTPGGGGGSNTVITGRKGYAIEAMVRTTDQ